MTDSTFQEFDQYSVGKRHVYVWTGVEERAWQAHAALGLDKRIGVYRWNAEVQADGSIFVWDPVRLTPPSDDSVESSIT